MEKDLIINVGSSDIEIALTNDQRLMELNIEKNDEKAFSLGDVYLGKVKKLIPTLNAAFVDIGDKKDAFVHYLDLGINFKAFDTFVRRMNPNVDYKTCYNSIDIHTILEKEGKIENVFKQGQPIIVQIVKEPISTKGSRLTAEISIAGRNIVLLPFGDKVNVSQKISSNSEKKRLERLMYSILPPNYGVILRTASEGKKAAVLHAELRILISKWENSWEKVAKAKTPNLLFTEASKTNTILRDLLNDSFSNIYINDEKIFKETQEYISMIAPEQEDLVKLYKGHEPIFDYFHVTKQLKSSFGKVVPIKQGAYLVIETTEALHVVDVNSGTRVRVGKNQEQNAYDVNCHAADEIARQLKLRDMGGIIIVDFIDMDTFEHRNLLHKRMQELMANDRAKHNVLPLTKFGLMQITRQRVRAATIIDTLEKCPMCNGTGKITSSILIDEKMERALAYYIKEKKCKSFILTANPLVEAYITKKKGLSSSILKKWEKKYKIKIRLQSVLDSGLLDFEWLSKKGEKLD
ncbi:MAG: Rne/Rng family ribonuclease [Bacteroidales bacterium]